jgi:hypothetical protein
MHVVDFWVFALGGNLQESDRQDLRGELNLRLVEVIRWKWSADIKNVRNWLSVQIRYSAYDFLIALRELPLTNHDIDVPDVFMEMPSADVLDLLLYACHSELEKQVAHLLMSGIPRNEIALITNMQPQRISELKKRIFDRARRKNNRLEKTQEVLRTSS